MTQVVVGVGIVLAILIVIVLATYNALMQQRQDVRAAWSSMDEFLKRRYELVPVLISTVRSVGGAAVEKLPAVTDAKNQAAVAFNPAELARAESSLTQAIADVLWAVANNPSTARQPGMVRIQQQIAFSEKQIESARRRYNDQVETFNSAINSFPHALTARLVGLHPQPVF